MQSPSRVRRGSGDRHRHAEQRVSARRRRVRYRSPRWAVTRRTRRSAPSGGATTKSRLRPRPEANVVEALAPSGPPPRLGHGRPEVDVQRVGPPCCRGGLAEQVRKLSCAMRRLARRSWSTRAPRYERRGAPEDLNACSSSCVSWRHSSMKFAGRPCVGVPCILVRSHRQPKTLLVRSRGVAPHVK